MEVSYNFIVPFKNSFLYNVQSDKPPALPFQQKLTFSFQE